MKSEYFILLPNNICNSLQSFATEEMNQRNILPINKTRILEAIANVIHSPHMNDKKQRYSSQSWPTFYNFDKLFNLARSDR